jgi:hypothetical protein
MNAEVMESTVCEIPTRERQDQLSRERTAQEGSGGHPPE